MSRTTDNIIRTFFINDKPIRNFAIPKQVRVVPDDRRNESVFMAVEEPTELYKFDIDISTEKKETFVAEILFSLARNVKFGMLKTRFPFIHVKLVAQDAPIVLSDRHHQGIVILLNEQMPVLKMLLCLVHSLAHVFGNCSHHNMIHDDKFRKIARMLTRWIKMGPSIPTLDEVAANFAMSKETFYKKIYLWDLKCV